MGGQGDCFQKFEPMLVFEKCKINVIVLCDNDDDYNAGEVH